MLLTVNEWKIIFDPSIIDKLQAPMIYDDGAEPLKQGYAKGYG